jgi:hypothetical protein
VGYVAKKKKNVPIFGIKFKELRDYTTNESDVGKGISRIPLQLARQYEEDVMEEIEVTKIEITAVEETKPQETTSIVEQPQVEEPAVEEIPVLKL